jgi:hypothetical protein
VFRTNFDFPGKRYAVFRDVSLFPWLHWLPPSHGIKVYATGNGPTLGTGVYITENGGKPGSGVALKRVAYLEAWLSDSRLCTGRRFR